MEMKIDSAALRERRLTRAWSQQQLADVAGVSLRTVQRIEKSGQAAPDSVQAIAAAFDIKPGQLLAISADARPRRKLGTLLFIPPCLLMVLSAFYLATASAEPVMLELSAGAGDRRLADVQLLTHTGERAKVILDNGWKIEVVSTKTDVGQFRIALDMFQPDPNGDYALVSSPVVITDYREPAGIKFDDGKGAKLHLAITPK